MSGISFRIAAPSRASSSASGSAPPSRPASRSTSTRGHHQQHNGDDEDDSDEDEGAFGAARKKPRLGLGKGDEEVVEFGREGAKSKNAPPPSSGPLVIPALPNKDWRRAAEELRAGRNPHGRKKKEMYIPDAGGGMSMRPGGDGEGRRGGEVVKDVDAINTEEVVGGLERPVKKERSETEQQIEHLRSDVAAVEVTPPLPPPVPTVAETDEQRALRELLGGTASEGEEKKQEVDAIISAVDNRGGPISEEQAFKRDLESRPDEASLEDYARVPVGSFGLAMLRGMGWQPGQAASRSGRGAIEAHVPSSRPALLGIGAKPMAEDLTASAAGAGKGGAKKERQKGTREQMAGFVPLMKRERERIEGPSGGGSGQSTPITNGSTSSRRSSRSPPPSSSRYRDDRDRDYRSSRDRSERRRSRSPDRRGSSRRDEKYESSSSSRRDRDRDYRSSARREDDRGSSRRDDDRGSSRRDEERRGGGGSSRYEDRDRDRRRDDDRRRY
ncbi:hypothetical protein JCM10213_008973 [Rhodosporidiobolus nylandii]